MAYRRGKGLSDPMSFSYAEQQYSVNDDEDLLDRDLDYSLWGIVEPKLPAARIRRLNSQVDYEKYRDKLSAQKDLVWNHPDFGIWSFTKVIVFLIGGVVKMLFVYPTLDAHLQDSLQLLFTILSAVPFGCNWTLFLNIARYNWVRGVYESLFPLLVEIAIFAIFIYAHFKAKAAFRRIMKEQNEKYKNY
jgi:hypothetical protein